MDSDEKKISLDELPDEGSPPSPQTKNQDQTTTRNIKIRKGTSDDPRKEILSRVKPDARLQVMQQSWRFDKREFLAGWIIYVAIVIGAQVLVSTPDFAEEWLRFDEFSFGSFSFLNGIIMNPIVFILLTPFFFDFQTQSAAFFDVTFDGISTVQKIYPERSEFPTRIMLKWPEIENVQRTKAKDRDILVLKTKDGKTAQLIWDFDLDKKKGLHHLLKSLIPADHSLRKFLEKDIV